MKRKNVLILQIILPLMLAVISIFGLAQYTSSPEFHAKTIASLDEKRNTVLELTAASAVTATGITMLPGDAATPIANKLTDLSSYFLLVICALYLEKYLLTITGYATFGILIPLACVLFIANLYMKNDWCKMVIQKLIALGIAIFLVVPISVQVSNIIETTYASSIQSTLDAAKDTEQIEVEEEEKKGFLEGILDKIEETVSDVTANVEAVLNTFIEALAVMIVTSCVIPVLVILFFVWIIKIILGINIPIPTYKRASSKGQSQKE